jgi:hypothetical protein
MGIETTRDNLPPGCAPSGCALGSVRVDLDGVDGRLLAFASKLGLASLHITDAPLIISRGRETYLGDKERHSTGRCLDVKIPLTDLLWAGWFFYTAMILARTESVSLGGPCISCPPYHFHVEVK